MDVVVLFFTDPDSYNSRRQFVDVFESEEAVTQYLRKEYEDENGPWVKAAFTMETVRVKKGK